MTTLISTALVIFPVVLASSSPDGTVLEQFAARPERIQFGIMEEADLY